MSRAIRAHRPNDTTRLMVHKAERGLFELRQGRALCVTTDDSTGSAVIAAVEGLGAERLTQLRSLGRPLRLLVTHHRAQVMGLVHTNGRVPPHQSLGLAADATPAEILLLATAAVGPAGAGLVMVGRVLTLDARPVSTAETAGLALARLGRFLPALVSVDADPATTPELRALLEDGTILDVSGTAIERLVAQPGIEVTHVAEGPVPLQDAEDARFVFFREGNGFLEHVAILIGARKDWAPAVPVRLHSACLTGDIFGSLRCDCGEQLQGSLRHLRDHGGGVLVYLAQEGRGIGLGNKIRAYGLQQTGLDTIDADGTLGFGADERRYDAAVAILEHLGIERIQLLTNNPEKVRAIEDAGILVVDRKALHGRLNRHNLPYVHAKVHRAGHWLMDMISETIPGD